MIGEQKANFNLNFGSSDYDPQAVLLKPSAPQHPGLGQPSTNVFFSASSIYPVDA
jgi:hypothetical protein